MTVDFVATDWGTVGQRRASKNAAGPGRLGHVPHLARRRRLRQPGGLHRAAAPAATSRLVRLARRVRRSRRSRAVVRRQDAAEEEKAAMDRVNKAAMENVDLHPDRLLQGLPGLAQNLRASSTGRCPSSGASRRSRVSQLEPFVRDSGVESGDFEWDLRHARPTSCARSLATMIPVMAIVALFVFSLLYIAPGDPAAVIAGDQATPAGRRDRSEPLSGSTGRSLSASASGRGSSLHGRSRHVDLHHAAGDRAHRPAHRADAVADAADARSSPSSSPCRWASSPPGRPAAGSTAS